MFFWLCVFFERVMIMSNMIYVSWCRLCIRVVLGCCCGFVFLVEMGDDGGYVLVFWIDLVFGVILVV